MDNNKNDIVIGCSSAILGILRTISSIAPLDVSIFITGESGTGKSQIARVIHEQSGRHIGPFMELNCGALPENLIENELFGSQAGAHSSATKSIKGKIEVAKGGTLFLDEIGELPFAAQSKLLQFLQSGHFFPLGAATPHQSDVRVITATNSDLREAIRQKKFRRDLYYRINVYPLDIPPLRERREDILDLTDYFLNQNFGKHGINKLRVSAEAMSAIQNYDWPGNVRELKHSIEVACITASCEGERHIYARHLPFISHREEDVTKSERLSFHEATQRFQQRFLKSQLDNCGWNISEVAREISLSRSHLNHLIKSFALVRPMNGRS